MQTSGENTELMMADHYSQWFNRKIFLKLFKNKISKYTYIPQYTFCKYFQMKQF